MRERMGKDGVVSRMQSLQILSLGSNNLSANIDSLEGICKLTALRSLDLAFNGLNDNGIPKCVGNLSLLEGLYLWRNELTDSFSSLTGFCGLSSLRTLDLGSNNINDNDGSSLPMCLGNLSSLENLFLYDNNLISFFGKSIPGLKQLRKLFLSSNHLTDDSISPWIYNLTSLTTLLLGGNRLSNSNTMRGFCKLRNLRVLDVSNNSFGGSIPICFGNMNNFKVLYLPHNQFKGTIPTPIFKNLTMLTIISFTHNQFNGSISFSMFANLSKLIHIDISENAQLEVETEYPHWVPTFQLRSLLLNSCILNNRSGNGIPTFISSQRSLETLDARSSFLRGTIPSWLLYNATVSSLNLRGNSLKGPFPQSTQHNKSMLQRFDISDNKIYGVLPPDMGTLFPNLVLFNVSKNELRGTIPLSISKLQKLTILDLSQNNLFGEMPHGLISNNTSLKYLKLSNNKLQGNILSKFSNMTELAVLLLDNNGFTGTIASDMLSSPSLKIIDLRKNNLLGPIPSWLPALVNLGILFLGGNFFNGPIPLELCLMKNLRILDLSNNAISGGIPSCLNNISSWMTETPNNIDWSLGSQSGLPILNVVKFPVDELYTRITTNLTTKGTTLTYGGLPLALITGIDLSMNQLVGNIPSQVGDLKELHLLNLSNNFLSGSIPESFQNLKNIESLDLSHNKLVGTIPPQMIELHSLSTFNVSFNSLSGMIPYEKQFHTFDERSYMGNPDLSGPPLRRNCYNPSQPQDRKGEEEGSAILDSPIFFLLVGDYFICIGILGFHCPSRQQEPAKEAF
eukprot:TRINITY_DN11053_c0_g1_i2.p1 TRINITY_DN11053_c0_g1~~TRINITY_DN11053_c0_g1_i2.p1  ORF type:complete len:793 (-),score=87.60 TRINITY_DN11053_c0_g1_i2:154-2532(-)